MCNLLHGGAMLPDPVEGLHLAYRLLRHVPLAVHQIVPSQPGKNKFDLYDKNHIKYKKNTL